MWTDPVRQAILAQRIVRSMKHLATFYVLSYERGL